MTNTSNNNLPKTETIYEIKNETQSVVGDQIPSFEEFMKTYNESEGISDNYQSEFESYEGVRVKGTYYGPGFWDDVVNISKAVGTAVGARAIVATGLTAIPISAAAIGGGYAQKK
jgi:hypothetical protein